MKRWVIMWGIMFITYGVFGQLFRPWVAVFGNDNLSNGFNFHYELQYRSHGKLNQLDQFFVRSGIGYSFSDETQNILLGYGYFYQKDEYCYTTEVPEDERTEFVLQEHRVFQQYIMKHQLKRLLINHRYRFEQRFASATVDMRLRYYLSGYLPLNDKKVEKGTFFLGAYNELFMHVKGNYFDRNRSYFSIGYAATDYFKIELGVMRQTLQGNRSNIFQISVFNNLDFKIHH